MTGRVDRAAFERTYDEAMRARAGGEPTRAIRMLRSALGHVSAEDSDSIREACLLLGHLHANMRGELQTAERYFRRAIEFAPLSELASVWLFDVLRRQARPEAALEEAVRLLWLRGSRDYRRMLSRPGYGAGLTGRAKELFEQALWLATERRRASS